MLDVDARSLTATRWVGRAPRIALALAAAALALAGLRSATQASPLPPASPVTSAPRDFGAEALAEAFARDYLTFDDPARQASRLVAYGATIEPPAYPAGLRQQVRWTAVSGVERRGRGSIVTVIAATTRGRVALAVPILRGSGGDAAIDGQPAIVGTERSSDVSRARKSEREVDDGRLRAVARRAIKNYLSRDLADLSADLSPGASVHVPANAMRLRGVDLVTWSVPGRRVALAVRATDRDRVRQRLRYELAVRQLGGRWLVQAVHTNPTPEEQP